MNDPKVTPFLYDGNITVRVIDESGTEAWVTTDVCRAIGITNAADAVMGLDDDETGIATIYTIGGLQQIGVVYESRSLCLDPKGPQGRGETFSQMDHG